MVATATATRPAFRKPWENGARAYPEADTFAAALEGFKRKRKSVMFHMTNTGEAGNKSCAACGIKLRDAYPTNPGDAQMSGPDKWSTWHYVPSRKAVVGGVHYGCSWRVLLSAILRIEA